MSAYDKAPERIWAVPERNCTVYMSGNSPIAAQDGPFTHRLHGAASEYIRADLVEAMETENQRLREALKRIANYREEAHAYDDDMGHLRRCFDIEAVMFMEAIARATLSSTGEK